MFETRPSLTISLSLKGTVSFDGESDLLNLRDDMYDTFIFPNDGFVPMTPLSFLFSVSING